MSSRRVARPLARSVAMVGDALERGARCGGARDARRRGEDVGRNHRAREPHRVERRWRTQGATAREDERAVVRALRAMAPEARARAVGTVAAEDAATRDAVMATLATAGTLDRAFEDADANGDGVLDKKEFLMALSRDERRDAASVGREEASATASATAAQLRAVALSQAVPFVGFGLCDNAVMIMAGESIETALGVGLGLSTMAAAGFGNTVSDVVGIGLSSKIETFAERLGFQAPQNLTQAQRMTAAVRWAKVAGATGGVTVGCLLGMFPLLLGW